MSFRGRVSGLAVASLLFAAAGSAQQTEPPQAVPQTQAAEPSGASPVTQARAPTQAGSATQTDNKKITLDVVVTDKSGQSITGLQQQDFTLLDNKEPQSVTSFTEVNGRQAPVEVIVVIDAVNASFQNVAFERGQIDQFLRSEGGNLAYPAAIAVSTDKGAQVVAGFLADGNALSATLDKTDIGIRDLGRAAGYYGAAERLQISLTSLHEIVGSAARRPGRKIIIWISPGWPLMSGPRTVLDQKQQQQWFANIVGLSTEMRRGEVTIYSIDPVGAGSLMADAAYRSYLKGVTKPGQVELGDLGLPVLAVQSGGVAFGFTNGIADRLHKCVTETVPYYEISFDPPAASKRDEYHQIEIKMAKPGLNARTRQGYYGEP
jgi:VWFA-related protein